MFHDQMVNGIITTVNSYWQNPGKLVQQFFHNFSFSSDDSNRFQETHPTLATKFQFSGHELNQFLENSSMKPVCVITQNSKIGDWMSFPECGLAHDQKIEIAKKWIGFPAIGLSFPG